MKKALLLKSAAVACALGAAAVLTIQAAELWEQRQQLVQEEYRLGRQLQLLQQFALAHPAYEQEAAEQERELEGLRAKKLQLRDSNLVLQRVQELAAAEGLELVFAGTGAGRRQQGQQLMSMQLEVQGDFYAVVRWLRQLERQGIAMEKLQLGTREESDMVVLKAAIVFPYGV